MTHDADVDTLLPGDPETVQQLATALRRAAELLRSAGDRVAQVGAPGSVWEGQVAQAFLDHVSELSRRAGTVEADLTTAATQLTQWREGLLDRRQQLAQLREEIAATSTAGAEGAQDAVGGAERDRLQTQVSALVDEHEAAGATVAQALRRVAEASTDPANALDGNAWLMHAETLLRQLEQQVGAWVAAQGPALTDAVTGIGQSTALSATVGQAAGSLTPGLDVALGAAVVSVAAAAPGSHRLISAARRAQRPIPLESLPAATFDRSTLDRSASRK